MAHRVRITAGSVTCTATLSANRTAWAIWNALPISGTANLWGDEIYFEVPVDLAEDDGQEEVNVGDLAYWPPGNAVCIFWGPTPASRGNEPRAASAVNVFGHIDGRGKELAYVKQDLAGIKPGARVRIEPLT
jgi:uncharacterized protein